MRLSPGKGIQMKRIARKGVLLFTAFGLLILSACGTRDGGERSGDNSAELLEGMIWVTKVQEVYPLDPGCTVTGVARLGGNLLVSGEDKNSAPVLGLVGYMVESDGSVSVGDAVSLPLDEPDAVDEGHLYGICAGGDGFFYILTGELPAMYTDSAGEWVENESYAGRYSILQYSEGGELTGRMKLTGWHGGRVEGIAVGAGGEVVLYGDSYFSLLRWNGDVIHTEELGEECIVESVSCCGQGLVASLFEYGTARGEFYRIDSASGNLSPLSAVCPEEEFALYEGNWSVTQGLSGEYIASDAAGFFAIDFDAEVCAKLFTLNNQPLNSELPYVCRLSENTFAYTVSGRDSLFFAFRSAQEYKDRSVVRVALYRAAAQKAGLDALNAAGGDYIYEYTIYEDNQIDRLQADLSSKNAPDLLLFGCFGGLDTNSEYFDDLYSYIDSDPELSRDSFLPNLLEALSVKGRLTQLWEYVQINTMVARASDVGDGTGLTPADYNKILEDSKEYSSMFLGVYGDDQEALLSNVAVLALSVYTDRDNASCSFDSESFAQLLQWVKDAGGQFTPLDSAISYRENFQKIVAHPDVLVPMRVHFISESLFGEPVTFAGYPLGEASGNYYASDGNHLSMAIPAYSANKEGAWAYICNRVSFNTQYNAQISAYETSPTTPIIPVNYEAMKRLASVMLDEEEAEQMIGLAGNTKFARTYTDDQLYEIIVSAGMAYLAGDKSLEETVGQIQSRAGMYMAEKYG